MACTCGGENITRASEQVSPSTGEFLQRAMCHRSFVSWHSDFVRLETVTAANVTSCSLVKSRNLLEAAVAPPRRLPSLPDVTSQETSYGVILPLFEVGVKLCLSPQASALSSSA